MDDPVRLVEALGRAALDVLRRALLVDRSARCPTTGGRSPARRAPSTRRRRGRRPGPPSPRPRRPTRGPCTSGVSPSSGSPSGVSESRPLIAYLIPTDSSPSTSGTSCERVLELELEVLLRERQLGRRQRRLLDRRDLVGLVEDRPVRVRADLEALPVLALVHVRVHVAHDREVDRRLRGRGSAAPGRRRSSGAPQA